MQEYKNIISNIHLPINADINDAIHLLGLSETDWITTLICFRLGCKNDPLLLLQCVTIFPALQLNQKDSIYLVKPGQSSVGLGLNMVGALASSINGENSPLWNSSCDAE